MTVLDVFLLGSLLLLLLVAVKTRSHVLSTIIAVIYLGVILVAQFSLEPLIRSVSSARHRDGKWSSDFRDGSLSLAESIKPYRPYVIVSSIGLVILATIRRTPVEEQRKKNPS